MTENEISVAGFLERLGGIQETMRNIILDKSATTEEIGRLAAAIDEIILDKCATTEAIGRLAAAIDEIAGQIAALLKSREGSSPNDPTK